MNCNEIDLNKAISAYEKALRRALGTAIELEIQLAPKAAGLHVDETAIAQILMGLIGQARKSLPGGGVVNLQVEHIDVDEIHARIQPGARRGEFVRLTVADNGSGLPTERLLKLFAQLPPAAGKSAGNILSLPLIAGIVKRRGGWVEAHSHTGGDTTIHLYFPMGAAVGKEESPVWQEETILLVEDEVSMRRMVKNVLERMSYRVIEADTGAQALAIWEKCRERVNLLLTDMVMPEGVTGRELAQRLTATKRDLRVVYTSGFDLNDEMRRDMATGAARFLHKPYDMRRLLETVHRAMTGDTETELMTHPA